MSAPLVLNHTFISAGQAAPERWLIMLHGIYGAGRNWQSIARRLAAARPEWGAILVDLRLHGGSRNFSTPHSLEACAQDLQELLEHLHLKANAISGHSFGGKVALTCLKNNLPGLEQVWIMDSTPETRPPSGSAWHLLEVLRRLPATFSSRQEAIDALLQERYSLDFARWLVTNLAQTAGGWRWNMDFDGLEDLLVDFFRTDLWPVVENPPPEIELHFVKAEDSDTLSAEGVARIEAIGQKTDRVFLHRISGGHWVNLENPQAVLSLLEEWLS
jgi:pimeloyl-ACP methyl ester carboxylesterase